MVQVVLLCGLPSDRLAALCSGDLGWSEAADHGLIHNFIINVLVVIVQCIHQHDQVETHPESNCGLQYHSTSLASYCSYSSLLQVIIYPILKT